MADLDPKTGKPVVTSAGKFMGWNTIFGRDGDNGTPYMTRIWFWRFRCHIFHHPDTDPDPHDHPFNFVTFPLTSYVEEVTERSTPFPAPIIETPDGPRFQPIEYVRREQIVPAFRLSYRPATHCHRVLGAYAGYVRDPFGAVFWLSAKKAAVLPSDRFETGVDASTKIVTLVWFSKPVRSWGFLKNRDGKWCWIGWRDYILGGGKDGPCQ